MKKTKRILALIGAALLFCLYASSLVLAFINTTRSLELLRASIAATIILPVLLYAYSLIYKLTRKSDLDQPPK